jgi:hypothetical protein
MLDIRKMPGIVLTFLLPPLTREYAMREMVEKILGVLRNVPVGREARGNDLRLLETWEGNPDLGGYDTKIWVRDALEALSLAGLVQLEFEVCGMFC